MEKFFKVARNKKKCIIWRKTLSLEAFFSLFQCIYDQKYMTVKEWTFFKKSNSRHLCTLHAAASKHKAVKTWSRSLCQKTYGKWHVNVHQQRTIYGGCGSLPQMVIFAAIAQKRRRNYNVPPQSNMRGVMRYFRLTLMYVWGIELEKLSGIRE